MEKKWLSLSLSCPYCPSFHAFQFSSFKPDQPARRRKIFPLVSQAPSPAFPFNILSLSLSLSLSHFALEFGTEFFTDVLLIVD
ncbi:hypothetical protein S83_071297 [Arachis hypogaea]